MKKELLISYIKILSQIIAVFEKRSDITTSLTYRDFT